MFGLQLTIYCNHTSWTCSTCFPVLDYNRFFWTRSKSCHRCDEFTAKNRCFLTLPPSSLSLLESWSPCEWSGAWRGQVAGYHDFEWTEGRAGEGRHISSAGFQGWAKRPRILFTSWPNSVSWHHWRDVNRGTQEPLSSDAKKHFHLCPPSLMASCGHEALSPWVALAMTWTQLEKHNAN